MPSGPEKANPVVPRVEVVRGEGGADRPARVTRGRLNPHPLESAVTKNLAVGDAVERHAAGEAEVRQPELRRRAHGSIAA